MLSENEEERLGFGYSRRSGGPRMVAKLRE